MTALHVLWLPAMAEPGVCLALQSAQGRPAGGQASPTALLTDQPGAPASAAALFCTHTSQRIGLRTAGGSPQLAPRGRLAAPSPQPSPSPVAVEPSSVQAIRRTGSNAAAARLMSTAKTGGSTRTAAQSGGVRPTAPQPNAGRAPVQGTSRAGRTGTTRAGPAAPAPAAHRPATVRATTSSSKAAASTPAGQSVAKRREAASGRLGVVQSESVLAPAEPKHTRRGQDRTVKKKEAPARTQPARQAKNPGHTWNFLSDLVLTPLYVLYA